MKIEIPGYKSVVLKHIVFDYNGTLAKDGKIKKRIKDTLKKLSKKYKLYVITADTFGTVEDELKGSGISVVVLKSKNHTKEKRKFIKSLKAKRCAAVGNGNNDKEMLKEANISIAVINEEGCSKEALLASDIVCKDIKDALELFLYPKRLVATLRR